VLIAGIIVCALGIALLLNVLRLADRLAAISRPFPWWFKGIGADYPVTHRVVGAGLLVIGVTFIAISVHH
jgi:hypothetical protein